jgi:hypothetical protein
MARHFLAILQMFSTSVYSYQTSITMRHTTFRNQERSSFIEYPTASDIYTHLLLITITLLKQEAAAAQSVWWLATIWITGGGVGARAFVHFSAASVQCVCLTDHLQPVPRSRKRGYTSPFVFMAVLSHRDFTFSFTFFFIDTLCLLLFLAYSSD